MTILYYPKCSTCLKAIKWLDAHGLSYDKRDIVKETPTADELKAIHQKSNQPLRKLFNTSGKLYREQRLATKLPTMSEEEMYTLLASNGMLIKRPLLITDDQVLIGFKEDIWQDTLL
jgi:arsenate reductase